MGNCLKLFFIREHSFDECYEIGEKIGSGHFADVHLCKSYSTEQTFAVKIISKEHLIDPTLLDAEVDVLKKVGDHQNILRLIDTFDHQREFLIVTEFCEGGDLFGRIVEEGHSSEKTTINIMKQLAEAIRHIHECGVTHRDLKPENILLLNKSKPDIIKIADFGLSKIRNNGDVIMRTVCGTWAYCAPEVISRKPYNEKVDNWTLGILMFVLLAGYHPFDMYGDTQEPELLKKIENLEYDFDDDVWTDISDGAKELIQKTLQKYPKDRMTCEEFLDSDWINERISVNDKVNAKALANLEKLVDARKQMKVTLFTTLATSKFKSKLKLKRKTQAAEESLTPSKKNAWMELVPKTS